MEIPEKCESGVHAPIEAKGFAITYIYMFFADMYKIGMMQFATDSCKCTTVWLKRLSG